MFHRHHDAGGDHAAQPKPGREQQWEKIVGNVVDKRLLPAQYPPHPKIFGVQLHPEGREPFRAEVHVSPDDWNWEDLYQPQMGDVRGFVFNPASGETRFDMTDGRNSWAVQNAESDALMGKMLKDQPAPMGEAVTGPPWVVPAICPTCGAAVDQAKAAMDLAPHCEFCHQPLPAQPRARF
ncbi:MAG TPA: hypothetical protein VI365_10250 [Trebonia sp.]